MKYRGNHRYYRNLEHLVRTQSIDFAEEKWYDFWHLHLDNQGRSNINSKHFCHHLSLYMMLLHRWQEQAKLAQREFQVWVEIDRSDGKQSAIYFHTPNPNHLSRGANIPNYPYRFPNVIWEVEIPNEMKSCMNHNLLQIGRLENSGEYYFIRSALTGY